MRYKVYVISIGSGSSMAAAFANEEDAANFANDKSFKVGNSVAVILVDGDMMSVSYGKKA